ncbi:hypothetical protein QW180_22565 [Vibrio sinaloensis]|nr:hypothetical protein [Vibrio sinaloensis]
MPKQIAAAAASNTLPDLIEVGSNLSLAFAEQGITDADAATAVVNNLGKDRIYKGALKKWSKTQSRISLLPFLTVVGYKEYGTERIGLKKLGLSHRLRGKVSKKSG